MKYKDTVLPILREAQAILLPKWGNISHTHKDQNAANTVTECDVAIENLLKEKLKVIYPDIGFVGEETGGNREAERFWLVDPIDGTTHFIRGLPFCTSMIALIERGEVVFSAIYDFVRDEMYFAEKGQGAWKDDVRLHVSNRALADSYIAWETHTGKPENAKQMIELLKRCVHIKTISGGWEFAQIASGKLDGRVMFDPWGGDYDYAPCSLLVSEAGGIVANLGSDKYDYRNTNFIAANPVVYPELQKIFKDYKAS